MSHSHDGLTTFYLAGLLEADVQSGVVVATRTLYTLQGQVVATRTPGGLFYLHADHLGSVALSVNAATGATSSQEFDPWGAVRAGSVPQTSLNYTGQRKDGTGLLYYHARYYDPALARWTSPDSIVPGAAMGAGGALGTLGQDQQTELRPLTVDFHEPSMAAALGGEDRLTQAQGFWFQLSSQDRQQAKDPSGPSNPQALNRYSYVLDNPLRYSDPTGHTWYLTQPEADTAGHMLIDYADQIDQRVYSPLALAAALIGTLGPAVGPALAATLGTLLMGLAQGAAVGLISSAVLSADLRQLGELILGNNGPAGEAIAFSDDQQFKLLLTPATIYFMNRSTGAGQSWGLPMLLKWFLPGSLRLGAIGIGREHYRSGVYFTQDETSNGWPSWGVPMRHLPQY